MKKKLRDMESAILHGIDFESWFLEFEELVKDREVDVVSRMLIVAARLGFKNFENKNKVFEAAELFGAHFMPVHFYSPIPNTASLKESSHFKQSFSDLPILQLSDLELSKLLEEMLPYANELLSVPESGLPITNPEGTEYFLNNPAFGAGDAFLLYGFLRKLKPNRIIEIGSGYSTLMGLQALSKNGSGRYMCIEPYPEKSILSLSQSGTIDLLAMQIQDFDLTIIKNLTPGDVLFIDSTHVVASGSDVVFEVLKILPIVPSGVYVHIHDIFYPYEYPESWVIEKKLFWTEQYLLLAFLTSNPHWKIIASNNWIGNNPTLAEKFLTSFTNLKVAGGGSLWLQRL
jgi:hypothetical protein